MRGYTAACPGLTGGVKVCILRDPLLGDPPSHGHQCGSQLRERTATSVPLCCIQGTSAVKVPGEHGLKIPWSYFESGAGQVLLNSSKHFCRS